MEQYHLGQIGMDGSSSAWGSWNSASSTLLCGAHYLGTLFKFRYSFMSTVSFLFCISSKPQVKLILLAVCRIWCVH